MPKNENEIVRIELTPAQKEQVKAATDKSAEAIELTVQELEARIAPRMIMLHRIVQPACRDGSLHRAAQSFAHAALGPRS